MIDMNDMYPEFKENTKDSLKESYDLAGEFHNTAGGRIKYGFAPRFALSCTEELLKETAAMLTDFEGSIYHTHSSENKSEIEAVRNLTGKENIDYFNSIGILSDKTVLAHGIHVNDNEINLLKKTSTRIAHCPSSNLKLGSGIADIPRYLKEGISVSLGADGAPCNNNLSMFTEMRLASLIQKPRYSPTVMDAKQVFRLATIDGARALHLDSETGSIEPGKKADFALLDLNKADQCLLTNDSNIYSGIVYSAGKENVVDVFVEGKQLVSGGKSLIYDENELVSEGRKELKELIARAG
jgi:cytosine/adenosine deaminase-related metal-dependent hydrolase